MAAGNSCPRPAIGARTLSVDPPLHVFGTSTCACSYARHERRPPIPHARAHRSLPSISDLHQRSAYDGSIARYGTPGRRRSAAPDRGTRGPRNRSMRRTQIRACRGDDNALGRLAVFHMTFTRPYRLWRGRDAGAGTGPPTRRPRVERGALPTRGDLRLSGHARAMADHRPLLHRGLSAADRAWRGAASQVVIASFHVRGLHWGILLFAYEDQG